MRQGYRGCKDFALLRSGCGLLIMQTIRNGAILLTNCKELCDKDRSYI
jgi:hypothetical protein